MKYLSSIVEALRRGLTSGIVVARDEALTSSLEVVYEATPKAIEDLSTLRKLDLSPRRPAGDLFALDSSSRVVETPYVFLAVSAASVFSRFTGRGVDVPALGSLIGVEEPSCGHLLVIPEVESVGVGMTSLENNPAIVARNPLGLPYDTSYNKYAALNELRLYVETCVLEESLKRGIVANSSVLFLDGPLIYPSTTTTDNVADLNERRAHAEAIDQLNRSRIKLLKKLIDLGVHVISIVKRLNRSYILSTVDPAKLAQGKVSDEVYLSLLTLSRRELQGESFVLGPLLIRQKADYGVDRIIWYVGVSRRVYPLRGGLGNYVFYRVETVEDAPESEVLGYVVYDSVHVGSTIPLSLLIVDKRVKKITSSLVNYFLHSAGLSEEATARYISVF